MTLLRRTHADCKSATRYRVGNAPRFGMILTCLRYRAGNFPAVRPQSSQAPIVPPGIRAGMEPYVHPNNKGVNQNNVMKWISRWEEGLCKGHNSDWQS